MDDTISRAAAIDAMMKLQTEDIEVYGASIPEGFDGDRAVAALKALPSAQLAQDLPKGCTDTISRQAAIDATVKMFEAWYGGSVLRDREIRARFDALPSAQPECEDAVSRAAVINAWRNACNSVMSKCACHYDDDIKDTVYDNTSEVNAVLRCNKEFKNALKVLPLITPKQPGWIPCSHELPKPNEEDGNGFYKAYLVQDGRWMDVARWDGKYWIAWGYSTVLLNVVAWMPLPKPWEGGQNG